MGARLDNHNPVMFLVTLPRPTHAARHDRTVIHATPDRHGVCHCCHRHTSYFDKGERFAVDPSLVTCRVPLFKSQMQ